MESPHYAYVRGTAEPAPQLSEEQKEREIDSLAALHQVQTMQLKVGSL
jgi:hypothetical protein